MRRIVIALLVVVCLMLPFAAQALADSYVGWDAIRGCFEDGKGQELVVEDSYSAVPIEGDTEWDQVLNMMDWVNGHISYMADDTETWTSSDQLMAGSPTGDCEEYAILLCALLRFRLGIPSDRVWVAVGVTGGAAGHAWVGYKHPTRVLVHLDPTWNTYYVGSIGGGMLRFNDQWVKGGGYLLKNPNLP